MDQIDWHKLFWSKLATFSRSNEWKEFHKFIINVIILYSLQNTRVAVRQMKIHDNKIKETELKGKSWNKIIEINYVIIWIDIRKSFYNPFADKCL